MKSATISDLIFLKVLFKLVICALKDVMDFKILSLPIGMMICPLEESLVVILILGFIFLESLIVLYISLIFFEHKLGKFFFEFQNFLDLKI